MVDRVEAKPVIPPWQELEPADIQSLLPAVKAVAAVVEKLGVRTYTIFLNTNQDYPVTRYAGSGFEMEKDAPLKFWERGHGINARREQHFLQMTFGPKEVPVPGKRLHSGPTTKLIVTLNKTETEVGHVEIYTSKDNPDWSFPLDGYEYDPNDPYHRQVHYKMLHGQRGTGFPGTDPGYMTRNYISPEGLAEARARLDHALELLGLRRDPATNKVFDAAGKEVVPPATQK